MIEKLKPETLQAIASVRWKRLRHSGAMIAKHGEVRWRVEYAGTPGWRLWRFLNDYPAAKRPRLVMCTTGQEAELPTIARLLETAMGHFEALSGGVT